MVTLRAFLALLAISLAVSSAPRPASATIPQYKLGDVADQDVATPVALTVVNTEATEKLKQQLSEDILPVVRFAPGSASEAEKLLRGSMEKAKGNFLTTLRQALAGQPTEGLVSTSPAYAAALRIVAGESPAHLPLAAFAPLWLQNKSDHLLLADLVQPVREVMTQPIAASKSDQTLAANQAVQLLAVRSLGEAPTPQELETPGTRVTTGRILSLWRARRLVETSFGPGQEEMARFAASFVQANAISDPALTELYRAKRRAGITANDTYDAAQVIVRKGQIIDQRALNALAAMREKSLIGTLQTKLDQEQTVAGQIKKQTKWIVGGLAVVSAALLLILWRLRSRPSTDLHPALVSSYDPGSGPELTDGNEADHWRSRALIAEGKANRAHHAIRTGVLGWMREKIFQTLFKQRSELLNAHKKAELEMGELEQRLSSLHTPLQERIRAYEQRIEELERELAVQGEANRKLIGARIAVTRQQLDVERQRSRVGSN